MINLEKGQRVNVNCLSSQSVWVGIPTHQVLVKISIGCISIHSERIKIDFR